MSSTTSDASNAIAGDVGAEHELAEYASSVRFSDVPPKVRDWFGVLLRDHLGCTLSGSRTLHGRKVIAGSLRAFGAVGSATIIGADARSSPVGAALANGTSAHSVELDDTHRRTFFHVGVGVIPAALAVAEHDAASPEDLASGIVAGYEVALRLALALNPGHRLNGWHTTATCGSVGAAVAAGRVLGFAPELMRNSLSLGGTQATGPFETCASGSEAKRFHGGRPAMSGVVAAMLAAEGFTAADRIITGDFGLGRLMTDTFDASQLVDGLGNRYHSLDIGLKRHASCRFTHGPIDAALAVVADAGLSPDRIEHVRVSMSKLGVDQVGHAEPTTLMGAQFSAQFSVALAMVHGRTNYADFRAGLDDDRVLRFARQIELVVDPSLDITSRMATVEVRDVDGQQHRATVEVPRGEPEAPWTEQQLEDKFLGLASDSLDEAHARTVGRNARSFAFTSVRDFVADLAEARQGPRT